MNVLHIASQSAGILPASPHISCGFKHRVSQEIRERDCQVTTEPRSLKSAQRARTLRCMAQQGRELTSH